MNAIFERTALFVRTNAKDGRQSIRRIPWDIINVRGARGAFASQVPVQVGFDSRSQTASYTMKLADMINNRSGDDNISEVVKFEFFESEEQLYGLYKGAFGSFANGDNVSGEFGFPHK